MVRVLAAWGCVLLLALSSAVHAQGPAENRVALLIGNANYRTSPLRNPVNDVRLMEQALKQAGFRVFRAENANRREMQRMVREFGELLKRDGGVGLFYFSGHGLQVKGSNYLVPVDADIQAEEEVAYDSLDVGSVLDKMEAAGNRMNMVILDACRSNPFVSGSRSATRGLAQVNAPSGTIVAYATSPGNVALDGTGSNSPYTHHLARAILQQGLPVEEVFKQVRTSVRRDTNNAQTPWENTALEGQFFFRPAVAVAAPQTLPAAATAQADRTAIDLAFWNSVKDSSRAEELQAYLVQFPEGQFAALAKTRLAGAMAPVAVAPPPRSESGAAAHYELADEIAGTVQRQVLASSVNSQGHTVWTSGDVVRHDGQVVAVRIGARVVKVASGHLWRFPLAAGQSGEARIQVDGSGNTGSLKWSVASAGGPRLLLTGQAEIPLSGLVGGASMYGSWRAEYEGGGMVPVVARADLRPSAVGGGAGPEKFEFRMRAAAVAGPLAFELKDALTGQSQRVDASVVSVTAEGTFHASGELLSPGGELKAVRFGNHVAKLVSGSLWRLPPQVGDSGEAVLAVAGQNGHAEAKWRVRSSSDGATVEAQLRLPAMSGHGAAAGFRTGRWSARYGAGAVPVWASFESRQSGGVGNDVERLVLEPVAAVAAAAGGPVLVLRDDLTGIETIVPLSSRFDERGATVWSSGDVIGADGKASAVRVGSAIVRGPQGFWKFPLQAGQSGEAPLDIEGAKTSGSMRWTVAGVASGFSIEAQLTLPPTSGHGDQNTRQALWRAEYAEGETLPRAARLQIVPGFAQGGYAPERFTLTKRMEVPR